jgi:hypothetical protein
MIDWICENWDQIFMVIGIVGTACTAIVKAFSGCKWASWIVKICDTMSVVNTKENKEKIAKYSKKK